MMKLRINPLVAKDLKSIKDFIAVHDLCFRLFIRDCLLLTAIRFGQGATRLVKKK